MSKGPWLELSSGKRWFLLHPESASVDVADIAAALSKLCRFGGHTSKFYSVAQHCVLGAKVGLLAGLTKRQALHVLLHDASEAYLVDIPRPAKALLTNYKALEDLTTDAIVRRYGLEDYSGTWPAYVKVVDDRMLVTEQRDLMPPGPRYLSGIEPYPYTVMNLKRWQACWPPDSAEREYLECFNELTREVR